MPVFSDLLVSQKWRLAWEWGTECRGSAIACTVDNGVALFRYVTLMFILFDKYRLWQEANAYQSDWYIFVRHDNVIVKKDIDSNKFFNTSIVQIVPFVAFDANSQYLSFWHFLLLRLLASFSRLWLAWNDNFTNHLNYLNSSSTVQVNPCL